jgi:phospholipid/cholesterol/gamma-HCH transport system permease protein
MAEPLHDSSITGGSHARVEVDLSRNVVSCSGDWTIHTVGPLRAVLDSLAFPRDGNIEVDGAAIGSMDSAGVLFLRRLMSRIESAGGKAVLLGLRPETEQLIHMIDARASGVYRLRPGKESFLWRVGERSVHGLKEFTGVLGFVGEITLVLGRLVAYPRRLRWRSVLSNLQHAGFDALPIVGLLSLLMGIVIAYQGATQLTRYGANIFVVDLVGLSILRELAPLLTAIIIAGRSGSAFTAQIGTMKVTEEIDALRTIGIPPMELLVLPKLLALLIGLPLLTVYADVVGVAGGMIIASTQLDVGFADFVDRFGTAVKLSSYMVGIGKAPVFAGIIAVIGCYQGFRVGAGAESVGRQTTISVVQAIFLIIIADALFSVAFSWLGI